MTFRISILIYRLRHLLKFHGNKQNIFILQFEFLIQSFVLQKTQLQIFHKTCLKSSNLNAWSTSAVHVFKINIDHISGCIVQFCNNATRRLSWVFDGTLRSSIHICMYIYIFFSTILY